MRQNCDKTKLLLFTGVYFLFSLNEQDCLKEFCLAKDNKLINNSLRWYSEKYFFILIIRSACKNARQPSPHKLFDTISLLSGFILKVLIAEKLVQ